MSSSFTRRDFLRTATAAGGALLLDQRSAASAVRSTHGTSRALVIASANGLQASARAMELIKQGKDALDAVVAGVNIVEDDPKDMSVGYGGYPNEDGIVELDASVMHGPTGRGGAVAALRNIKNPSRVAQKVMERSDHVLLVGEGAFRFARAHGFKEENLLTDETREAWLRWKENMSTDDDWLPEHTIESQNVGEAFQAAIRNHGTINCNGLDLNGNISGCTTTSGMAFKLAGRVGDSPIFGAGLYVDNEVGAAGSTGRGEANLLACSSVLIVEAMRQGKSPADACILACERIAKMTKMKRLLDEKGRPKFQVNFYAITKKGEYGAGSIWSGSKFAVNTGEPESRLEDSPYLFKR
jgi:N4-(beta-N-acetylglucosaminyl)-L-asparaginase